MPVLPVLPVKPKPPQSQPWKRGYHSSIGQGRAVSHLGMPPPRNHQGILAGPLMSGHDDDGRKRDSVYHTYTPYMYAARVEIRSQSDAMQEKRRGWGSRTHRIDGENRCEWKRKDCSLFSFLAVSGFFYVSVDDGARRCGRVESSALGGLLSTLPC